MAKEELKKEFEKYLKDSSDYYDPREPLTERKLLQLWLDCAEPRDKRIAELEAQIEGKETEFQYFSNSYKIKITNLKAQIEKMKCCGNCVHCYEGAYHNGYKCKDHARESVCDNWEMMTDEVRKEMLEDD